LEHLVKKKIINKNVVEYNKKVTIAICSWTITCFSLRPIPERTRDSKQNTKNSWKT
jgi:hypothetical protein